MLTDFIRAIAGGTVWRWREARSRRAMCAKYPDVEFQYGAVASGSELHRGGLLFGWAARENRTRRTSHSGPGLYLSRLLLARACGTREILRRQCF